MAKPILGTWADYLPWREKFHALLDPALYPSSWLDGEVACGRMHLFVGKESAILASIKVFPSGLKEVQGEAAVGKLREIASDLIPFCENWARARGCKSASIQSREGWVRMLRDYRLYQTTIRKPL